MNTQDATTQRPARRRHERAGLTASVLAMGVVSLAAFGVALWWSGRGAAGPATTSPPLIASAAASVALFAGCAWLLRRVRPLDTIAGAMRSMAAGEPCIDALRLDPRSGPEARAWNSFLDGLAARSRDGVASAAEMALSGRRPGDEIIGLACDAMWNGVLIFDDRGVNVYANGAAALLLARTREQVQGAPLNDVLTDEPVRQAVSAVLASAGRKRVAVEVKREHGDQENTIRFSVCRVAREGAAAALVLVEDLTQQRAADKARDNFVAQATHELRTPLTNIRLYVERAIEEGDADPSGRAECLNVINQEARRLDRTVAEMLSVSEIEAGSWTLTPGDVRVDALIDELRKGHEAQARDKEISLDFVLPPKLPVIHADRDKVALALHNIVGNALKYTPAGGRVTVTIDADDKGVRVAVQDTGIGIAPDEAERVFDKFYRSKDARVARITGTGLGLTLARDVIRMHGGDVTVQSQLNKGSLFTITLPAAPGLARAA